MPTVSIFWGNASIDGVALTDVTSGRVFQRSAGLTTGPAVISGTFSGKGFLSLSLEGQVRLVADDSIVVAWTALTSFTQGHLVWSGRIPGVPQGGAYKVEVRNADNHAMASAGSNSCYMGMWILMYGQSNMGVMANQTDGSPPAAQAGTGWYNTDTLAFTAVPSANGARELLNGVNTKLGIPVAAFDPAVTATGIDFLVNGNWSTVLGHVSAIGGDFECIVWNQGENSMVGIPVLETAYLILLRQLQDQSCSATGRTRAQLPMFTSSQGRQPAGSVDDPPWYVQQQKTNVDENSFCTQTTFYSHSSVDFVLGGDNLHFTGASCGKAGKRFATTVAKYYSVGSSAACWFITAASIVDATHTDTTLVHGLGTDFTPTSAITGAEVSFSGGAAWASCTGARTSATNIRWTHASSGGNLGSRIFRYQVGDNPDISAAVLDNSSLAIPLNYTADWIVCSAASPTPTPVKQLQETAVFNTPALTNTISYQRIGTAAADRLVQVVIAATVAPTNVTLTPFNFDASASDWVGTTFTPVSLTKVVDNTAGTIWQGTVASGNVCSIVTLFPSNPFGVGTWVYTVPSSQLSSTTPVASVGQNLSSVSNVVSGSINLATTSGGYILVGAFGSPGMILNITGDEAFALDHFYANPNYPTGQQTQAAHACPTATSASSAVTVISGQGAGPGVKMLAASWR